MATDDVNAASDLVKALDNLDHRLDVMQSQMAMTVKTRIWQQFALAAISAGHGEDDAASISDHMLDKFLARFPLDK